MVERKGRSLSALTIDRRLRCADVAGEELYLSEGEFELLLALADAPECIVTYEELGCNAFAAAPGMSGRLIDSHALRLRRKLELRGLRNLIIPYQGVGFRLQEHPEVWEGVDCRCPRRLVEGVIGLGNSAIEAVRRRRANGHLRFPCGETVERVLGPEGPVLAAAPGGA